ncbi:PemK-like protein [Candidatus Thiomargarita nelsonii]|uniref:mRNA interferase n=1 Tax=Candidatus Thiomargarita nelsonii TaxID=1003181 RepID=A0A176RTW1_9GAMM|nr:PemK-like protein [Candidatus Thiomargarita nelsonii]
MKRGEIYTANLRPRSGAEIRGDKPRPVIIVSHDGFNQVSTWQSIIVIPISTSSAQAKRGPTAIFLPQGSGGLNYDSIAVCHQITTLDRSKLTHKIGTLSAESLRRVEEGIKIALDMVTL